MAYRVRPSFQSPYGDCFNFYTLSTRMEDAHNELAGFSPLTGIVLIYTKKGGLSPLSLLKGFNPLTGIVLISTGSSPGSTSRGSTHRFSPLTGIVLISTLWCVRGGESQEIGGFQSPYGDCFNFY